MESHVRTWQSPPDSASRLFPRLGQKCPSGNGYLEAVHILAEDSWACRWQLISGSSEGECDSTGCPQSASSKSGHGAQIQQCCLLILHNKGSSEGQHTMVIDNEYWRPRISSYLFEEENSALYPWRQRSGWWISSECSPKLYSEVAERNQASLCLESEGRSNPNTGLLLPSLPDCPSRIPHQREIGDQRSWRIETK